MSLIEEALKMTTDTKACVIGPGAAEKAAEMFRSLWPTASRAIVIDDVNTKRVAGDRVIAVLESAGLEVAEHTINPDGSWFHATYDKVEEVRDAIKQSNNQTISNQTIPIAVGSGTINDLVKRAAEELGLRYMVVGTAASMDGYTSFGAAITKDGMKQTLSCKAPLGCIVDSRIAAEAPHEMTASGYADLIAKIPAGADWMLADAIGSEAIHPVAWRLLQPHLRDMVSDPAGCAAGGEPEIRKLCEGLVLSAFAMQAMSSSRPASGTEHQVSHYWDMENLCYAEGCDRLLGAFAKAGTPVSHGFKVGIGTLFSTKALEFLLRQDLANLDVEACVAKWPKTFDEVKAGFPAVFGNRPDHIKRAEGEYSKKYSTPDALRVELSTFKAKWPALSAMIRGQILAFDEMRAALKAVGAPYEPEMVGVSRARFRETVRGVPYMRNRYFGLDLLCRLGLLDTFLDELFGPGGLWEIQP